MNGLKSHMLMPEKRVIRLYNERFGARMIIRFEEQLPSTRFNDETKKYFEQQFPDCKIHTGLHWVGVQFASDADLLFFQMTDWFDT